MDIQRSSGSKFRNLVIQTTVILFICSGLLFAVLKIVDTSEFEEAAKALRGKPVEDIERRLGKPHKVSTQAEFNTVGRFQVMKSFVPKEVPKARGRVWSYSRNFTLVMLYEDKGVVDYIYIGGT